MAGRIAYTALLLCSLCCIPWRSLHAQAGTPGADSLPEAVLLDLRIAEIDTRTIRAFRIGDAALLPVSILFAMSEIRFWYADTGRMEARLHPGDVAIRIDLMKLEARVGQRRIGLDPTNALVYEGELYLGTGVLGELLGLPIRVSWAELTATIVHQGLLPVARRLRREVAHRALLRTSAAPGAHEPEVAVALERPRWDGVVVDYALTTPAQRTLSQGGYSLAFGANVLGGSLEASARGVGLPWDETQGSASTRVSWLGVWRGGRWVKQLRVGDGLGTGRHPRPLRGIAFGNAPLFRPAFFGPVAYAGRLEPDWEVEVYRGNQLIAIDSSNASGGFGVELPGQYGENLLRFVAHGPHGEELAFSRILSVPAELLRRRQLEYGVSAGRCMLPSCETTVNLDLRYGLLPRLTVRTGVDEFRRDSVADLLHPYVGLVASPTATLRAEVDAVLDALVRGSITYVPTPHLRATGSYTRFDRSVDAPVLTVPGWRSQLLLSGTVNLGPRLDWLLLDGAVERAETTTGDLLRTRFGASLYRGSLRVLPYARLEHRYDAGESSQRLFGGAHAIIVPRATAGSLLGRLIIRALAEIESGAGVGMAGASVTHRLVGPFEIDAGALWYRGQRGPTFSLLLSTNLSAFRSYTSVTAPTGDGGSATASNAILGSIIWDAKGRDVHFSYRAALQRAGITGRIFLDENLNGRYDPGELRIPNAYVRVGSTGVISDAEGRYQLWDIVPFEPVSLEVDSLSLPSPLWVPATDRLRAELGPNRYLRLDFPIVSGGTVEGTVVQMAGGEPREVSGVSLRLRELRTGRSTTLTTFNDGSFTAFALRPGVYEVTVDPRALEAMRGAADPVQFTVTAMANGDRVGGVRVEILPIRSDRER